jgi:hypothetical protein
MFHSGLQAFNRMAQIFRQKDGITGENCARVGPHNLVLPGDVAYGAAAQFEMEARTALRLAHFLCLHLQVCDHSSFASLPSTNPTRSERLYLFDLSIFVAQYPHVSYIHIYNTSYLT